jgi:hypothetical protein
METLLKQYGMYNRFISFSCFYDGEKFYGKDGLSDEKQTDAQEIIKRIFLEQCHAFQLTLTLKLGGYHDQGDEPYFFGSFDTDSPHWKNVLGYVSAICSSFNIIEFAEDAGEIFVYTKAPWSNPQTGIVTCQRFRHYPKHLAQSAIPFKTDLGESYIIERITGLDEDAGALLRCPREMKLKRITQQGTVKYTYIRDDKTEQRGIIESPKIISGGDPE